MSNRTVVLGSRRSNLALTQSNWVLKRLQEEQVPYQFSVKEIVTKGDRILDVTLSKVGGKGLFVKEIEQALFDKEIDLAVHSMKDMPAKLPEGLTIACIPVREDHRDAFISVDHIPFEELPSGAIIGTSSLRRGAQLLAKRPDISIQWIRGNIDTRLKKLQEDNFDAIILAAAGLKRMGWSDDVVTRYLDEDVSLPAVGQGALAIECRSDDEELINYLKTIHCEHTARTVSAERTFLHRMEGGCQIPIAGYATLEGETVSLTGLVAAPDGSAIYKETVSGTDPVAVGEEVASILTRQGAKTLIDAVKETLDEA
ncbi:hydroxymethylbilane synthase [Bacillus fonticola]|uniref:hydroxymethylbilane synthase n=1 Tax=Bacillus fonticola TaxID=2728853 RepID=UPI001475696A|nr:hydroxymethylbilane synthase [Bacillus fonticola]